MKKIAWDDYEREFTVFKNSTAVSLGASIRMCLFNHVGSIEPGDIVQVTGQPLQNGDISYWPGYESEEIAGRPLTGVYLSLDNIQTGSCEVLIKGRVRAFWHPGIQITLLARGSRI